MGVMFEHISVKNDRCIDVPNHVNICESAHVLRKVHLSLLVILPNDGSLFNSFFKKCSLHLAVLASSNKMFIFNDITDRYYR